MPRRNGYFKTTLNFCLTFTISGLALWIHSSDKKNSSDYLALQLTLHSYFVYAKQREGELRK